MASHLFANHKCTTVDLSSGCIPAIVFSERMIKTKTTFKVFFFLSMEPLVTLKISNTFPSPTLRKKASEEKKEVKITDSNPATEEQERYSHSNII